MLLMKSYLKINFLFLNSYKSIKYSKILMGRPVWLGRPGDRPTTLDRPRKLGRPVFFGRPHGSTRYLGHDPRFCVDPGSTSNPRNFDLSSILANGVSAVFSFTNKNLYKKTLLKVKGHSIQSNRFNFNLQIYLDPG